MVAGKNSNTRFAAFGVGVKSGAGCRSRVGERMISLLMGINDDYRSRPNAAVNISGGTERRLIEFNQVCRLFSSGVFYRLTDNPAALVKEDDPVMHVHARPQLERPVLGVHPCDRFDVSSYLVGEHVDRRA